MLPDCRFCNGNSYQANGGRYGTLTESNFTCGRCKAFVQRLSQGSDCQVLVFIQREACEGPDKYDGYTFPAALTNWYNQTLFPTWRHRAKERATDLPVYPPKAPRIPGVAFMVNTIFGWQDLDYNTSDACEVPEDPILKDNREFFAEVWAAVSHKIEQSFPERTEVRNEYGGIQPWYSFKLNEATFTVGWRKRVVSISVDAPGGISTEYIATLAAADSTTYSASSDKVAHTLTIHAWSKAKTIEYLTVLCRAALIHAA